MELDQKGMIAATSAINILIYQRDGTVMPRLTARELATAVIKAYLAQTTRGQVAP